MSTPPGTTSYTPESASPEMAPPAATGAAPPATGQTPLDAKAVEIAMDVFRRQQNLVAGVGAGLLAALAGAGLWAGVTVLTSYQIGWMAVGIGFLVGYTVRLTGKGVDPVYGFAGAGLSLLGCLAGNLLSVCWFVAVAESMAFGEVLARLDAAIAVELLTATFSPIDLLFYGIAVWEGYRLSFRQLTEGEVRGAVQGTGATV